MAEPYRSIGRLAFAIGSLFAMGLFFFISGLFTPAELTRYGPRRYLRRRILRLGIPLLLYWLVISPITEYPNPRNAGFGDDFWAFVPHIWWPPQLGVTWFLAVLLVLNITWALLQHLLPKTLEPNRLATRLAGTAVVIGLASYLIRLAIPLGAEVSGFEFAQAPSWIAMFALGTAVSRSGGLDALTPDLVRRWVIVTAAAVIGAVIALAITRSLDTFAGRGTPASLFAAAVEGCVAVGASIGLTIAARRRWGKQGPGLAMITRAAFAALLVHQPVLVWITVALRSARLTPGVHFALATTSSVAVSFVIGMALTRLPRVRNLL